MVTTPCSTMTIRTWCNHHRAARSCICLLSKAKKALTRELRGIFADKNSVNILLTASLNSQRRTVGWIPSKWIPAKKCNCSSLTSDDHSKPPSLLCVRVCWDSWIRKWRVWRMSDRIQNLMHQIGSKIYIYQTGSQRCIRLDPKSVSAPECLRLRALCRHQPSWHHLHVMSRRLMQVSKHVVKCDKCHDMSWCHDLSSHVTGCLFRWGPVLSFLLIFT